MPVVAVKGLHAISLSPELVGASRSDMGDIRLLDSAGRAVPYLIREVVEPSRPDRFEPYTLLRNEALRYRTVLELERPAEQELEELHIWIRPTQVQKHVRVTGSDDRHDWFMVKDDHVVAQGAHGDPPHQLLLVVIPRSDYRYLRITLNDSLTPPMNVLGVGRFTDGSSRDPRFTVPEPLQFVQVDSGGASLLRIARSRPLLIERIGFAVADTGAYRRNGRIRTWKREVAGRGRKRHTVRYEEHRGSFVLASDEVHRTDIEPFRADSLEIMIDNGDDHPLRITGLWAASRQYVMLAHLDPGGPTCSPPATRSWMLLDTISRISPMNSRHLWTP